MTTNHDQDLSSNFLPSQRRAAMVLVLFAVGPLSPVVAAQHFPSDEDLTALIKPLVEDGGKGIVVGVMEANGSTRIVAYGRSLGGGAACALAREREVAALILESAFTSVSAIAQRLGVPRPLVRDRYDNLTTVASLDIPVLVVHGERDTIIPVSHGEELARAAGVELVRLPCGHNDCPRPWGEIREFLRANGL